MNAKRRFRGFLTLAWALVIITLPLASVPRGVRAQPPPGLVLWNKLGSDWEVTHSEVGPNGTIIGAEYAYEPAQHGYGYVRKAVGMNYVYFPGSIWDNLTYRGTAEVWVNPKVPQPVPFEYGVFGFLGAPHGFYGVDGRFNLVLWWGDGVTGQGIGGQIHFDEQWVTLPWEPA